MAVSSFMNKTFAVVISFLLILGKPPALPGDSYSLTDTGTGSILTPVNRSKFTGRRKPVEDRKSLKYWKGM
jgi:hypothetical protein